MMRYHNITKDDMLNGSGLRVVLWLSGCDHGCKNCHNPVTWDPNSGIPFDQSAEDELFEVLGRKYISGVTLSGGDPLFEGNRADVTALVAQIKKNFPQKTIWLYTGYLWEDICELPLLQNIDVLVDGRFMEELRDSTVHWKGSSNQRIIDVQSSLTEKSITLLDLN